MFAPRARERGITFVVDMPEPQRRPHADPVRIVQVLTNLVVNALDFTCSGGTVRVSADTDAERLCVCVSDTGAGIAPEDLPYVFERHWRGASSERRTSGSGLGLTIVRGIVQAHGGETWVRSAPGDGSRFYFTLPIDTPATAAG